jgi:hypothetical protein
MVLVRRDFSLHKFHIRKMWPQRLSVETSDVLRYLGYRPGKTVMTPRAEAEVHAGIARGLSLLAPAATLAEAEVISRTHDHVSTPAACWQSVDLARAIGDAARVTVVAATVGPAIEEETARLFAAGEPALATVVDAVGSAAIWAWVRLLLEEVGEAASQLGMQRSAPYSPGYGDWRIEDLPGLLEMSGAAAIGLTANEAGYLLPQKSLVGVVGWLRPEGAPPLAGCAVCKLAGCRYRRAGGLG